MIAAILAPSGTQRGLVNIVAVYKDPDYYRMCWVTSRICADQCVERNLLGQLSLCGSYMSIQQL